jgi:hypothetical protein
MSSLIIKNFTVLNTQTGQMAITGRSTDYSIIVSQNDIITKLTNGVNVPGTPNTISGGVMYKIGHMGTTFIQITKENITNPKANVIFIPDNIMRITFLGGNTSNTDSLIYGFTNSLTNLNITYNVIIANSNSQTIGDFFDIEFPDPTSYPTLYVVFWLLNGAWDNRTNIQDNICSITTNNSINFCVNPSYSLQDVNKSHFIFVNGINTVYGIPSRISIGVEDDLIGNTNDYANFKFSISSRFFNEVQTNDNLILDPICYVKGSKILCFINNEEKYINIEDIEIGMYVKTFQNGYKKIIEKTHSNFINSTHKIYNKVYRMKENNLFLTGGHSILVEEMTDYEKLECNKIFGLPKIQNFYRLLACISDKFEPVNDNLRYEIYHISVGEEDIIYANGILSETFNLDWYEKEFKKIKT